MALSALSRGFREVLFELSSLTIALICFWQRVFLGDDHRPKLGILAIELHPFFHVRLGVRADRVCRAWGITPP